MNLIKFETHCHSDRSKDSLNKLEDLIRVARARNISRLVISDHNRIDGALEAQKIAPDLIIIGEEILTTKGEILAFFVKELVPMGLSPLDTIANLRDQNAFISVSHPFDSLRHGWELNELEIIAPMVDAIEVFNARSFSREINDKAFRFAAAHHLHGTVGSDAHTLKEVGTAILSIPEFSDSDSLRSVFHDAIRITNYSSPFVRIGSTYASLLKKIIKPK